MLPNANIEIEKHFFITVMDRNGFLIYVRGSRDVIKYFIYGILIASIKQSLSCATRSAGTKSGSGSDVGKSAELDKIYWFITDKNLCSPARHIDMREAEEGKFMKRQESGHLGIYLKCFRPDSSQQLTLFKSCTVIITQLRTHPNQSH